MRRLPRFAFLLFPVFLPAAWARGEEPAVPPKPETPVPAGRFFDRPVDFWGMGSPAPASGRSPSGSPLPGGSSASPPNGLHPWGRQIQMTDGSTRTEDLPPLLVQVLEDPSPDNIRAYFEWRADRARKILRAAQKLAEYRQALFPEVERPDHSAPQTDPGFPEPGAALGPLAPAPDPAGVPGGTHPTLLLYFHRSGCSHCDTQDALLAQWLKERPEVTLQAIEFGTRPELWKAYQVRGTPSIVLVDRSGGASRFLEGVAGPTDLNRALASLLGPPKGGQLTSGGPNP
jgi:thiol-disulfide isomerase/thioredoxin